MKKHQKKQEAKKPNEKKTKKVSEKEMKDLVGGATWEDGAGKVKSLPK